MKMVGRENERDSARFNLLTFQCECGQVLVTRVH